MRRRKALGVILLAMMYLAPAGNEAAGTVAFSSHRCEGEADNDARPAAFVMERGVCTGALWLVEDDGSALRRISDAGFTANNGDLFPRWSPDGRRLAFTREGSGIWLTDRSGRDPRRIDIQAPVCEAQQPAWSPDGERIAFVARPPDASDGSRCGDSLDLFTMNPDGSGLTRLTHTPGNSEYTPSFSPHNRRIIFTRDMQVDLNLGDVRIDTSNQGVFTVTTDGRVETRLTESTMYPGLGTTFSPDGRSVALTLDNSLYTMNDGGRLVQRVAHYPNNSPAAWADGGFSLIFPLPVGDSGDSRLVKLNVAAKEAVPVPLTSAARYEQHPDWYPAGSTPSASPLPVSADQAAPAVRLLDEATNQVVPVDAGRLGDARAAAATAVRRKDLAYLAVDTTGIGRIEVAVVRRVGKRCRYLGLKAFSKKRRCGRPLFRDLGGAAGFKRRARRLKPGTYALRFRTRDRRGNVQVRTAAKRLQLLP